MLWTDAKNEPRPRYTISVRVYDFMNGTLEGGWDLTARDKLDLQSEIKNLGNFIESGEYMLSSDHSCSE